MSTTNAGAAASTGSASMKNLTRRDWWMVGGVSVVAAAAVIASFTAQAGLGRLAGWDAAVTVPGLGVDLSLSWLLPLCVDAYGAVATRITVNATYSPHARRHALIHAVCAVVVSVIGNAIYHALEANVLHLGSSRWVLVVAVSMVPPVALGALAHLMALCARDDHTPTRPAPADVQASADTHLATASPAVRVNADSGLPDAVSGAGTGSAARAVTAARTGHADHTAGTGVVELATVRADRADRADRTGKQDAASFRTPAHTGRVDRTAFIAELAYRIRLVEAGGKRWEPDYEELETYSGYRRSWCEKAVREARALAARPDPPTIETLTACGDAVEAADTTEAAAHDGAGHSIPEADQQATKGEVAR